MITDNSIDNKLITDEKLLDAMEKLSCKIELPKSSSCSSSSDEIANTSCGAKPQAIRLTEMTSAGG